MRRYMLVLACLALPAAARAADDGPPGDAAAPAWAIAAGPGLLALPRYPGSGDLRVLPVPAFDVRYRELFFASVQSGIGFNLLHAGPVTAGVLVRPDFGRLASDGRRYLNGLPKVGFAPELGGFAELALGRSVSLRGEARQAAGGHDGFVADVQLNYATPVGRGGFLVLGPRLRATDARYQRAYFGVSAADALRTGLPAYRPGGGLTSAGAGAALSLPLARRVTATLAGGYDRLLGDTRASPVVQGAHGSANQPLAVLSLSYAFKGGR